MAGSGEVRPALLAGIREGIAARGSRHQSVKETVTYANILPKLVNPRDTEEEEENTARSLEFVTKTSILAEMKIENRGKNMFSIGKKLTSMLSSMKIKMMDL